MNRLIQRAIVGGMCMTIACTGITAAPKNTWADTADTAADTIDAVEMPVSTAAQLTEAPVLKVEKGYNSVRLTWNAVNGAVVYTVQQSLDKTNYTDVVTVAAQSELVCELSDLYTNQKLYYRVLAVSADGTQKKSKCVAVKPVMQQPVVRYAQKPERTLDITWDAVEGADFYRVYRSLTPTGGYKKVTTVYQPGYCNKIKSGKTYYYKIMPLRYNPNGKKVKGTCSQVQAICLNENAPILESVTNGVGNNIVIHWSASPIAEDYVVLRSTESDGEYIKLAEVSSELTTWTDETAEAGRQYFYKIAGASGAESMVKSCFTTVGAPTGLTAEQGTRGVALTWTPVTGANGYEIYRAEGNALTYTLVGMSEEAAYNDSGVASDVTYSYKVAAIHGDQIGARSSAVSVKVAAMKISTRTLFLGPGVQQKLSVSSTYEGIPVWYSENDAIAVVDADGNVCGVAPGTTNVIVELAGVTASVQVNVTDSTLNGIDVSKWQQGIDWKTVKASGIKFAMLRLAHNTKDVRFEEYYQGALDQGIDVGVYCYSMATSAEAGRKEAQFLLDLLDGRPLTYPIALDLEDQVQLKNMNNKQRTDLILAYKEEIEAAGYDFIVYANLNWLNNYIDNKRLGENDVDIWIARYRNQSLGCGYEGGGNVRLWQYSSTGQIDGIMDAKGNYINVDLDVCYVPYE